jgi:Undecaprenyl-phosphate galactose phosphotransferase WbaP
MEWTASRDARATPGGRLWLREARVGLVVLADLAAIVAAALVAWLAWAWPVRHQPLALYLGLWPLPLFFVAGYAQAGLYPGTGLGPVETLRRLTWVTGVTFLVVAAISFALKLPYLYSRVTFALALVAALVLVPLVRLVALGLLARTRWWPEPVVVAGDSPERIAKVIDNLRWTRQLGYAPRGVLWLGDPAGGAMPRFGAPAELPVWSDAARARAEAGAAVALVASDGSAPGPELDRLQQAFHRVLVVRAFDDLPVEGIRVHNLGGFLGLEYTNNLLDARNQLVKRVLDLVLGGAALVVAAPLVLLAVLALELRNRGPAFYVQSRTGLGGRRIRVPKIRTMVPDAEEQLEAAMRDDPELRREWRERMKLRRDPRLVPGVGGFLRRFSLDELPQLWSVVRGDMSLVGPRPFPDYHLAQFPPRFLELRQRVRPGITGLWQVTVRSAGPLEKQESLDTYYIRNWSLWLDVYILARTAGAVLGGRGAF